MQIMVVYLTRTRFVLATPRMDLFVSWVPTLEYGRKSDAKSSQRFQNNVNQLINRPVSTLLSCIDEIAKYLASIS